MTQKGTWPTDVDEKLYIAHMLPYLVNLYVSQALPFSPL